MPPISIKSTALIGVLVVIISVHAITHTQAQVCIGYDPFSSIIPGVETLRRTLEGDMPGLVDRRVPFLFLPTLRAEARVRTLFLKLSGDLTNSVTDQRLDLIKDLGYEDQGIIIDSLVRLQLSRLSLRGQYDAYLRTFRGGGAGGRLDWPNFHYGFDFDLLSAPCMRFGVNMDFYPTRPQFAVATTPFGPLSIVAPRPVTAGIQLVWNPLNWGTLSWSFEARARRSLRTGSRIDEAEVATGVLSPQTVLGIVGLRGGWRYTNLQLQQDLFEVNTQWSGFFADLVYYY
ncbi:MAG TPA: hypothetical protein VK463_04950 [Desulfomonilaceae bacterium]|nr:hypothetical protein [Desulfomonilaceae bacterium]